MKEASSAPHSVSMEDSGVFGLSVRRSPDDVVHDAMATLADDKTLARALLTQLTSPAPTG